MPLGTTFKKYSKYKLIKVHALPAFRFHEIIFTRYLAITPNVMIVFF